ncbi:alpha/beta fold hydrolase [Dokdonella sp.]|uniref:alpha/beta fold hydrolase n=1 Tax=Dokdonella sp. TaxID=2291710 RepID=UPI003C5057B9
MASTVESGQFANLANGTRLHYARCGEPGKPLLIFVHGFPEFWHAWSAQLQEFGADHFAVAPDLRGFNLSDMPVEVSAYRTRHIVEDLCQFAATLGYEKFVLVAHDWGGAVAWNLAIACPELVEKLVIINSPHPWLFIQALSNDPAQIAASGYMNWLRAEGSEARLAADNFARMDGFFKDLHASVLPDWFDETVRARYHACWNRGLHGAVNYYRATPLHPADQSGSGAHTLKLDPESFRVRVPTLVIWGESDHALMPSLLEGLEQWVDDLVVERIPDGSHWVIHEQPDRINALMRGFLRA